MYVEFDFYNKWGTRWIGFIIVNITISAIKSTLARVISLMVSLGYGILVPSLQKYMDKILILSFLYLVSNASYMAVLYMNHYAPVSTGVSLVVSLPLAFTNGFFFYWIVMALKRTTFILKNRGQKIKETMISSFLRGL